MNIVHKFLGSNCKIDRELLNRKNFEKKLREIGVEFDHINFVNQVHGDEILVIDSLAKAQTNQGLVKADGIVTNLKKQVICVITADCAPIVLKDEKNSVAAVVHAGWRGAFKGVIASAVFEMKNLGAEISEIKAFIGPMIHQESYQVSRDFFDESVASDAEFSRFFVDDEGEKGKFLFDLVAFVKFKLKESGVREIADLGVDTYKNYREFSSYRKNCHLKEEGSSEFSSEGTRNITFAMIS